MHFRHEIEGGDFAKAGNVASSVRKILRKLNIGPSICKRIVIALYEAEVNVVAHAWSGIIEIDINEERIEAKITDNGPGIENIEQAMKEGYSTANHKVREMGFGAGMGLSNMKKNSDRMKISSVAGKGTIVELITYFSEVRSPKSEVRSGETEDKKQEPEESGFLTSDFGLPASDSFNPSVFGLRSSDSSNSTK
jgi:anti-sigma regulatory factor (Ser/Thr protein kinase)